MIRFIVGEDFDSYAEKYKKIIDNFMMNYDVDYSYTRFKEYNQDFNNETKKEGGFKVYILDIEILNGKVSKDINGLDAARYIREEVDDWNSIIIILTIHNEYRYEALGNRLFILDFVCKLDNYEKKLKELLNITMRNYGARDKCLCYKFDGVVKRIDYKHIITVEKEKDGKKCLVKTTYNEEIMYTTVKSIAKKVDNRFIKINRSILSNIDFIASYDQKENKLVYKNGMVSYDTSRENRKEVAKRVNNNV